MLGIDPDATEEEAEQIIQKVVKDGRMKRQELDKITTELKKTKESKTPSGGKSEDTDQRKRTYRVPSAATGYDD